MRALIFSGGVYDDPRYYRRYLDDASLVIAADSGAGAVLALGRLPDVLIGDMDSIRTDELRDMRREREVEVITQPPQKDYTDTELAVRLARERGAGEIFICGALGGRLDHELANVSFLVLGVEWGVDIRIVDEAQELVMLVPGRRNPIPGTLGDTVSLISLSEAVTGVTTSELKYPLVGETLPFLSPRGVSNVISGPEPSVTYESGRLLLVRVFRP
ncbi:MAG: thiamine diphosphokinase [Deltaproteobacteria bacterium]|nr:thiamine diphosphokinase [Candidatus Zymogenaceae bacterium]